MKKVTDYTIFTNGCFDILHAGHVRLLRYAKSLGDKLVVGLNTDSSVRRLKGETKPINNELNRKFILESIKWVDEVILFDEDTPYNLMKKVKPYMIVKGGDYKPEDVVGNDIAPVAIFPLVDDLSSSKIYEKSISYR